MVQGGRAFGARGKFKGFIEERLTALRAEVGTGTWAVLSSIPEG